MTTQAAPGIVPRWEWRTFGGSLESADARFSKQSPESVEESGETYLLSLAGDNSVKVRGGLMDVKELRGVNGDGLEQWMPVLKAGFPLTAADAATVFEALGVAAPSHEGDAVSLARLLELVRSVPELVAVDVRKRRERHVLGGCMAERTEIRTGSHATRTIAVEATDASAVTATVRELGLASRRNVSVPKGLKTLLGLGVRRYAVIDVGTNSVKFHIGGRRADGTWTDVVDRAEITRLGEGLDESGRLEPDPIERTVEAVAGMVDEARRSDASEIVAVGTAGLRIASNPGDLTDVVRERSGIEVEVISADEEARLGFLAVKSALGVVSGTLVVFDTGGGSSQFTFGHGEQVDERFSVDVGAVRFTERFGLDGVVSANVVAAASDAASTDLARLDGRPNPDELVGIGGAVTNMAAVGHGLATYDPDVVRGTVLDRREIERQIELYRTRTSDQRREIVGLQPKRAEVILAGACIVRTVLEKLGRESLTVSDRGLRHGVLTERFGDATAGAGETVAGAASAISET